jgi:hypothetical protein
LKRRCYRRFSKAKYSPINRRGREATIRDLGNDTRDNNSSHTRSRNEGCRKWRSWQGNAVAYDASLHEKRFPLEPAPAPQALRAGYPKERSLRFCKPARSCYPCFRCKRRPKLSSKEKPRRLDEYRTADLEAIKDRIRSACHRNRPTEADVYGEAAIFWLFHRECSTHTCRPSTSSWRTAPAGHTEAGRTLATQRRSIGSRSSLSSFLISLEKVDFGM